MVELTKTQNTYGTNKDDVVIVKLLADIPAGREIDFTGFTGADVPAGHVIITKDGNYRPHPISVESSTGKQSYGTITEGYAIAGVLYRTVTPSEPMGSVAIDAVVNEDAVKTPYTSDIKKALTAIGIKFVKDEEVKGVVPEKK